MSHLDYLFQENKSYGSKNPFAFILWCTQEWHRAQLYQITVTASNQSYRIKSLLLYKIPSTLYKYLDAIRRCVDSVEAFQTFLLPARLSVRVKDTSRGQLSENMSVSDPGKGVCADPVNGGAILGKGGPDPHSRDRERQLAPDKGRGKTWPIVKWEDDERTRKTTPSQLQNASMHRVS